MKVPKKTFDLPLKKASPVTTVFHSQESSEDVGMDKTATGSDVVFKFELNIIRDTFIR